VASNGKSIAVSHSWKYQYEWCPRQFKYSRIDRVRPDSPKVAATIVGIAIHRAIELMYARSEFTLEYLLQIWPKVFEDTFRYEKYVFYDNTKKQSWLTAGARILDTFYVVAKKKGFLIKPIAYEWKFTLHLVSKSGRKYTVRGMIDLIVQIGNEIFIIVFKSGKYKATQTEIHKHDQLTLYSLAFRTLMKKTETKLAFFYLRDGDIRYTTRTEADYQKVIDEIDNNQIKIEQGEFKPTYVKCYLCQFQARCRADDSVTQTGVPFEWFYREPKR